jgi:AbrB family looped-hinge helix DNA binding protein
MTYNGSVNELVTFVDASGRVVLPAAFRRALGLESGARIIIQLQDGELRVRSARQALADSQRLVGQYLQSTESLADELIAERRRAAGDE